MLSAYFVKIKMVIKCIGLSLETVIARFYYPLSIAWILAFQNCFFIIISKNKEA